MGNQRHRAHGDNHGSLLKGQVISTSIHERVQAPIKPMVFQSGFAKIEETMRSNLIEFTARVVHYNSPTSVLDALDDSIAEAVSLVLLCANRFRGSLHDRYRHQV